MLSPLSIYKRHKVKREFIRPKRGSDTIKTIYVMQFFLWFNAILGAIVAFDGNYLNVSMSILSMYILSTEIKKAKKSLQQHEDELSNQPILRVLQYQHETIRDLFYWLFYQKEPRPPSDLIQLAEPIEPDEFYTIEYANKEIKREYLKFLEYIDQPYFNKAGVMRVELMYPDIARAVPGTTLLEDMQNMGPTMTRIFP